MRTFFGKVRRSRTRGIALFGALLAVGLAGLFLLFVGIWLQDRLQEAKAVGAARKAVVLANSVESYVHANYGALTAGGVTQVSAGDLQGAGLLPDGFDLAGDAMKRSLEVWVLSQGGGRLRVISMQSVAAGDDSDASAGLFEGLGEQALGIVDDAGTLKGPTIAEDMAAFRAAAGGHPREHALAVYQEFDEQGVCGDWLYRRPRPGCSGVSVMQTSLDMGGNDVLGVGRFEVEALSVADELEVNGNFSITGELAVGTAVTVTGSFNVPGGLVFTGDAEFTGRVNANEVRVTQGVEAESATVTQTVSAGSVTTAGNVTASGVSSTTFNAGSGYFGSLSVGGCNGC